MIKKTRLNCFLNIVIILLLSLSFGVLVYAGSGTGTSKSWTPNNAIYTRWLLVKVETTSTDNSNGAKYSVSAKGSYGVYRNNITIKQNGGVSGDIFYKVGSALTINSNDAKTSAHSSANKETGKKAATATNHDTTWNWTYKWNGKNESKSTWGSTTYNKYYSRTMSIPKEHTAKTVYVYAHIYKPKTTNTPLRNAYAVTTVSMGAHTVYTTTYNANTVDTDGNKLSGTPSNIPSAQINCISGVTCSSSYDKIQCNISDVKYDDPALDGYTFKGWNTKADGSGTAYAASADAPDANITLYAQWQKNPATYSTYNIKYDFNGGTGMENVGTEATSCEDKAVTSTSGYKILSPGKITTKPTGKYTAGKWNTKADGTGITILENTDIADAAEKLGIADEEEADITLYAVWEDESSFTVYNPPVDTPKADKAKVRIIKKDAKTGEVLPGAIFNIDSNNGGQISYHVETDKDGVIEFEASQADLGPEEDFQSDTFTLSEVTAPNGYKICDKITFKLSVDANRKWNLSMTSNDIAGYVADEETDSNGKTTAIFTITVVDQPDTQDLIIKKTDADTGAIVPGAKFTLEGVSGNASGYIQSDAAVGSDGTVAFRDLKTGIYTLKETSVPVGYKLPNVTYTVTVTSDGVTVESSLSS